MADRLRRAAAEAELEVVQVPHRDLVEGRVAPPGGDLVEPAPFLRDRVRADVVAGLQGGVPIEERRERGTGTDRGPGDELAAPAGLQVLDAAGEQEGCLALVVGKPLLDHRDFWATVELPGVGSVELGTPLLFDVGVYLIVVGMALT